VTPCPVASRIFHDWSEALREASSPEHRDSEELLTSYAGAVASALDHHLAVCAFCKEPTMTQHTPGPWRVNDWGEPEYLDGMKAQYIINAKGEDRTAVVFGQANARLIAAAPELLEALRSILPLAVHTSPEDVAVHTARAAIAKATGG